MTRLSGHRGRSHRRRRAAGRVLFRDFDLFLALRTPPALARQLGLHVQRRLAMRASEFDPHGAPANSACNDLAHYTLRIGGRGRGLKVALTAGIPFDTTCRPFPDFASRGVTRAPACRTEIACSSWASFCRLWHVEVKTSDDDGRRSQAFAVASGR